MYNEMCEFSNPTLCAISICSFFTGSEQAAVKAGMSFPTPGGDLSRDENGTFDKRPLRYDLDGKRELSLLFLFHLVYINFTHRFPYRLGW